ncbi:MAG: response regulator [Verrucomicrobiota bacterium]
MAGEREIAIVDDDASVSQAVERLLTAAGWSVHSFPSAEVFLEWDGRKSISLLILDIHLPGISGLELYQQLAQAGPAPPVIFITGHDRPFIRQKAEQFGAAAYLVKPFQGRQLLEIVRRYLNAA